MTKDQWLAVKNALSTPWGSVVLNVDGYKLSLYVRQIKPLKFSIIPYVNGEFKGVWLSGKCEESRRFMRPVQVAVFKPTDKRRLCKGLSKKSVKEYFGDINKTFTCYQWDWPSFDPLRRHLVANNKLIELVEPASQ